MKRFSRVSSADKESLKLENYLHPEKRGEMWIKISGSQDLIDKNQSVYQTLIQYPTELPFEKTIKKDIHRTFPIHPYFSNQGTGQAALFNVLRAYGMLNRELGYCQGLNFITGILLLNMNEEQAFWVLVQMLKKYNLREMFLGPEHMNLLLYKFDGLIKINFTKLYTHFTKEGISANLFAGGWFQTLCSHKFPHELIFKIWDIFFVEGINIIFGVGLAILQLTKDELQNMCFEEILTYLKDPPEKILEPSMLLKTAIKLMSSIEAKQMEIFEKEFYENEPHKSSSDDESDHTSESS